MEEVKDGMEEDMWGDAEKNKEEETEKRGDVESRQEGGRKEGMYQQDM